jgi:benzoylformate decarboxylase
MDMLAQQQGGHAAWPSVGHLDLQALAAGFGCPSRRVADYESLEAVLDEVVPTLGQRDEPLMVEAVVAPVSEFAP